MSAVFQTCMWSWRWFLKSAFCDFSDAAAIRVWPKWEEQTQVHGAVYVCTRGPDRKSRPVGESSCFTLLPSAPHLHHLSSLFFSLILSVKKNKKSSPFSQVFVRVASPQCKCKIEAGAFLTYSDGDSSTSPYNSATEKETPCFYLAFISRIVSACWCPFLFCFDLCAFKKRVNAIESYVCITMWHACIFCVCLKKEWVQ